MRARGGPSNGAIVAFARLLTNLSRWDDSVRTMTIGSGLSAACSRTYSVASFTRHNRRWTQLNCEKRFRTSRFDPSDLHDTARSEVRARNFKSVPRIENRCNYNPKLVRNLNAAINHRPLFRIPGVERSKLTEIIYISFLYARLDSQLTYATAMKN